MKARFQKDKRHPTQNRVPHFVMQSIPAIICFISTSNFKHPIRNKILTSAVALNDCFDQIFRYIGIICEQLFSVLGQAVPAGRCQVLDNIFLQINLKKRKKKTYKAFSRYRTALSLVRLNCYSI